MFHWFLGHFQDPHTGRFTYQIQIESKQACLAQMGNFFDVPLHFWYFFPLLAEHKIVRFSVFSSGTPFVGQSELFFCVTQMISPNFVVRGWKFGYVPLWGAHPPKDPKLGQEVRKRPAEQPNGHLPKNQRYQKLPQDMGAIWFHWVGSVWAQRSEVIGVWRKKNPDSRAKSVSWPKVDHRRQKYLVCFNVALISKPPSVWVLQMLKKSMKQWFKVIWWQLYLIQL